MKLLIVSPQPEHPPLDAFRVFRALAEELSMRGHTVDYFVEPDPEPREITFSNNVTPTRIFGRGLQLATRLQSSCKRRKYDFLLTAASLGWCLSTFRQWFLCPHTQVLAWHGGTDALPDTSVQPDHSTVNHASTAKQARWGERLTRWAEKKALETLDGHFYSTTEAPIQVLANHPEVRQHKLFYLPNGVANHYYYPERHQAQARLDLPLRLLTLGSWVDVNASLIDAFIRLHGQYPQLRLSAIQPGMPMEKLLNYFPSAVQTSVSILPDLTESERVAAYRQHDIYLQTGVNVSGVPLSLLEGMASAMPVVADDSPGVRDILTHYENGLIIPREDSTALEQSVTHLVENPDLYRNLGENAYDYVSRYYTWRQVSDIFEAKLFQLQEARAKTVD